MVLEHSLRTRTRQARMAADRMETWVECVPNLSAGRDRELVGRMRNAVRQAGAALLDTHTDVDHGRSVLTLAAPLPAVEPAVLALGALAVRHVDLTRHRGVHPRVGALDVVPIVPLRSESRADCVALAQALGKRLWEDLGVPVYFYGAAARVAERRPLERVRKHGFEKLASLVRAGRYLPDIGGPELHPTAGACCVGVREFMAAFNVLLDDRDDAAARRIARAVRESAGGLRGVRALGLYLPSAGLAQVSMNVTALAETPLDAVFSAVCREAARLGVEVLGSELVGLVPRAALGPDPESLRIRGFHPGMLLENRLDEARGRMSDGGP